MLNWDCLDVWSGLFVRTMLNWDCLDIWSDLFVQIMQNWDCLDVWSGQFVQIMQNWDCLDVWSLPGCLVRPACVELIVWSFQHLPPLLFKPLSALYIRSSSPGYYQTQLAPANFTSHCAEVPWHEDGRQRYSPHPSYQRRQIAQLPIVSASSHWPGCTLAKHFLRFLKEMTPARDPKNEIPCYLI